MQQHQLSRDRFSPFYTETAQKPLSPSLQSYLTLVRSKVGMILVEQEFTPADKCGLLLATMAELQEFRNKLSTLGYHLEETYALKNEITLEVLGMIAAQPLLLRFFGIRFSIEHHPRLGRMLTMKYITEHQVVSSVHFPEVDRQPDAELPRARRRFDLETYLYTLMKHMPPEQAQRLRAELLQCKRKS